jgi:hypothetical protein
VTPRGLLLLGAGYALALALGCVVVRAVFRLDPTRAPSATRVVSQWRGGKRVAQRVVEGDPRGVLEAGCAPPCTRIVERIVDEGPLLSFHPFLIGVSVAAGRDGIEAEYGGRRAYFTASDLLRRQLSLEGAKIGRQKTRIGIDKSGEVLAELAHELGTDARTLRKEGRLRRFITVREDARAGEWPRANMTADRVRKADLRRAIYSAAYYLTRAQNGAGAFVYEVDATTGHLSGGYSWPRHGGATLFLAEAAAYTRDPSIRSAALLGARYLQRSATLDCGEHRCIGDGERVDAGSAALALLSYQALLAQGIGADLRPDFDALRAFLRSLQRPDGELMHVFDRKAGKPLDVQYDYYTGEAAFALARAEHITRSPADLRAASAALAHLVARRWSATENRYAFDSHHWTCQALAELWPRAPDREALGFCLDYQATNRAIQAGPSRLGDYAGGFARDPYFPPRITPTASRVEGAVATLEAATAAGVSQDVLDALEREVRGAVAFMLRFQFLPGPVHVLADPYRFFGAVPAGPTDLSVRIDYPQHAAGAMLRYLRLLEAREAGEKKKR